MVKVLRSFRRDALSKRGVRQYMIYAFGEIILLVAGILIALYVNNLNLERKEKRTEIRLYGELLEDLKSDAELFEFLIRDLKTSQDLHYALWSEGRSDIPATKIVYHVVYAPITLGNHINTPSRISDERIRNELNLYLTDLKYGDIAMQGLRYEIEKVRESLVVKGILDVDKVYDTSPYELPDPDRIELIDREKLKEAIQRGLLNSEFLNLKMSTSYAIKDLSAIKLRNENFQKLLRDAAAGS